MLDLDLHVCVCSGFEAWLPLNSHVHQIILAGWCKNCLYNKIYARLDSLVAKYSEVCLLLLNEDMRVCTDQWDSSTYHLQQMSYQMNWACVRHRMPHSGRPAVLIKMTRINVMNLGMMKGSLSQ